MSLKLITAPTAEPVSLEEAKAHLRVDGADDDALISALIVASRQGVEHLTGRALMPQTWELALDGFEGEISLQKAPLISVASVKYVDQDGVLQTMAVEAFQVDDHRQPARIVPAFGACWPSTRSQPNAVQIRFQAGYADAAAVPQEIKQWMLLRIGMLYENRESIVAGVSIGELPFVDRLLDAYKLWSV